MVYRLLSSVASAASVLALSASLLCGASASAQTRVDYWSDLSPQRFYNDFGTPAVTVQSYPGGNLYMWNGDWSAGITSDAGDAYASSLRFMRTAGVAMAYQGFTPFHQAEVPPGVYTHMAKGSFSVATADALPGLEKLIFRVEVEGAGQFGLASEYATLTSVSGGLANVSATTMLQGAALPEVVGGGHYVWEFQWDLAALGAVGSVDDFAINWTLNQNNYIYNVEVVQVIPEPGSIVLLLSCGAGVLLYRRRIWSHR